MRSAARLLILALCFAGSMPAFALDDTPQNREQEAARYMKAAPVQTMMHDLINKLASSVIPNERDAFLNAVKNVDLAPVSEAMHKEMVKEFTADELKALADFFGSPAGNSAMAKMGLYMSHVVPVAMGQIRAELVKLQKEKANEEAASAKADGKAQPGPGKPAPQK